ncbi:MAG: Lipid A export ATP-binding/permease protein MsbA [Chloroflexi bacterium AL-W]|nr:Lipid A export ATP-binding/permease protein MsbA [Chloroflexi bacterium AL-N1]NOK64868.1 Lipid A export ATP-binding/permease protein MsbA [Chloroflexi bacterium AL-N10]NOK76638.1 Lipid A export ATP-binding/permease protein MsbA [Chloroflexi bacterium AL-N5]NOK80133.1 Lipid A export ATP-binding/permease protein MsbA [Chloroflexi bacterium AL-W]NOK86646.1 Lipid A export ATP-binding/permease protein MsbA [Chloroflexi bacterium AL-N15]
MARHSDTRQSCGPLRWLKSWSGRIWSWWIQLFGRRSRQRVPVILQLNAVECGVACLAMILSYFGRQTSIAECRTQCDVAYDGVTALTMAQAARRFGLRVRAVSLEPDHFDSVQLPAIVHWKFNHFLIVEEWTAQYVTVVDPATGRRRLTPKEFDEGFTGVTLTFEPGIHFEQRRGPLVSTWLHYLFRYLRMPKVIIQIIAASALFLLPGLALPLMIKIVVDHIVPFNLTTILPILGLGIVMMVVAQIITGYLRTALLIYLQARLDTRLMLGFFEHILALPYRFFEQRNNGDILTRMGSNTVVRELLSSQTLSIMLDGGFVLVYLIILFTQSWVFGGLVFVIGALHIGLLIVITHHMHSLTQRDLRAHTESQSYVVETLTGIATLKAAGREDRALEHWSNLFFKHLNITLQRSQLFATIDTLLNTLRTFSPVILVWMGAYQVLDGAMTLGTMLALNALASAFLTPLASLVASGQQLQLVRSHLERLTDVLEAQPEQTQPIAQSNLTLQGHLNVQQLNFRYDDHSPWVLRDVSFTIKPGQMVAVVGHTGAGKSTLGKILLGLYPPIDGTVHYDGVPLSEMDLHTLRRQYGVVLQESFLFSGSVRDNISFGHAEMPLEQISAAAKIAGIHDEIMQFPMGYDTVMAEGGVGLSGGQRQRMAIARALAHKPKVLLLDEATSHLDAVTEHAIEQHLRELTCTRIVIAHRLSTIRHADLILVLEQGNLVEQGTHETLLIHNGYYAKLVHNQLGVHIDSAMVYKRKSNQDGSDRF